MKTKWPPDPETVLSDIAEFLALLDPALDAASDHGVRYFEWRGKDEIDPWLHSHLARDFAKDWLIGNGIADTGFEPKDLAMSGR